MDCDNSNLPCLSVVVTINGRIFAIHDLGEGTVINAIDNDIDEFCVEFESFENDTLTIPERMILKAYLWYKTKKYFRKFSREINGMEIDSNGIVRLVAVDCIISVPRPDGYNREYKMTLTEAGKQDHDFLVSHWLNWKNHSQTAIGGTKVERLVNNCGEEFYKRK